MDVRATQTSESQRLLDVLQTSASAEERTVAFESMLALEYGFWQRPESKQRETLRGFAIRIASTLCHRDIGYGAHVSTIGSIEDLAQDLLMVFFAKATSIHSSPRAWLIGTAVRLHYSALRRDQGLRFARDVDDFANHLAVPAQQDVDSEPEELHETGGRGQERRRQEQLLLEAIRNLPSRSQEILKSHLDGLNANEIASRMSMSHAAVRQTISRARRHLKAEMGRRKNLAARPSLK